MRIHTRYTVNHDPSPELKIEILPCYPPAPRAENAPSSFRCYVCWKVKTGKHLAALMRDNRSVCRECFPYIDEWGLGCLIQFDRRRGLEKADPSPKVIKPRKWTPPKNLLRKMRRSVELEKRINDRIRRK